MDSFKMDKIVIIADLGVYSGVGYKWITLKWIR